MTEGTFTLTLSWSHIGALNDAVYTLLNDPESEPEDLASYEVLRDEIKRQIDEQR